MKTKSPLIRIATLFSLSMLFVSVLTANAQQTFVWRGANAGAWLTVANWFTNGVTSSVTPTSNSIAQFTNAGVTNSVGINIGAAGTNNLGSFLLSGNATMTISNSGTATSGGSGPGNSNGAVRVFGTVSGGVTNLIVNDSASGHLIITNNGNGTSLLQLQLGSSGTINVSNVGGQVTLASRIIQDSGETNGFTKTGAGTLTIAGTNSNLYSGLTTLEAGVLRFNKTAGANVSGGNILVNGGSLLLMNSNQMSDTSALTNAGGTINFSNFTDTIGSYVQTSGTFTNGTLTASTYTLNGGTIAGNLGAGTATSSAGTTTLNGTLGANTVNVSGGTLNLGSANRLTNTAAVNLSSGTLGMGANNNTVNSFTITGGTLGGSGILTASTYALQGGAINARLGAGAMTVSGATTTLGSAGRLATSATLAINNGQLSLGGAETVAALSGSGGTLALGAHALTFGGNNANTSYAGTITGAGGSLTKSGTGTATLSGNNTFSGATTISGGRLVVNGTQSSSAVTVNSGASLAGTGTVGALTVNGLLAPGNSIGTLSAGNTTFNGGGAFELEMFDWTGTAGTGWDLLAITGDLTLNNTAGNKFAINLISLQNSTDPGASINFNQALSFTNTFVTYTGSLLGSAFTSDLFTVDTSGFQNPFVGIFSITNISQGLALVYTAPELGAEFDWSGGSGTWSTAGNWTNNATPPATESKIYYSGTGGLSTNNSVATAIDGLTFRSGAGSYTLEGSALTIGLLGIANDSSSTQTVNVALTLDESQAFEANSGDLVIGGTVALGANTLTVAGAQDTTINGAISGAGSLTKSGNGVLNLGGANNYSGGTLVSAGTLVGTTTSLQGGIINDSFMDFNQSTNGTYAGVISGSGIVTKAGSGSVTFTGANIYDGGTIIDGGALIGSTASLPGDFDVSAGASFAISQSTNGTFAGEITGAGRFVKDGSGSVTLSGANTHSGGTLVSGGTLIGSTASLQGGITNNAAVTFTQTTNGTYAGAMSGSGSLTKAGSGTVTLSGANIYSGGTTVDAGTLAGTTDSLQGNIANSGTVIFNQTTTGTYGGQLSGSGALVMSGSGAVTLGGNNSYTGATTVEGGSLIAANNNSLSSSAVTMSEGSVLAEAGVTLANNFTIGTAGSVTTNSFNSATVAGWDFNGLSSYGSSPQAPTTSATGFTIVGLSRGFGVATTGTAAANGWGGSEWSTNNSAAAAIDDGEFAFFSVTVQTGYALNLTNFGAYNVRRSGTGPTTGLWQWSTNGSDFVNIGTEITWGGTTTGAGNAQSAIALNGISGLQPIGSGTTVTFRVANYGASGTGTWYLNNFQTGDDFTLNGQVATVDTVAATGSGTLGISEAGTATFSGNIVNNNEATFTAASGGTATFSGAISGEGTLSKTGIGTVTLSGESANTFTGLTTVSAGTLQLNKTAGTDALAGDVTVNSGAILLISTSNQVNNGSTVSLSGGTITRASGVSEVFGNLNVSGSGFLDFGTGTAGTLSFGTYTPSALLTINNFGLGNTLTFGTDLTSTIGNSSFFEFQNGGIGSSSWDGSTFTITAIPEPSTYLAAAGLLSLMLWPSRKRLLKNAKKILGFTPPMRDRLASRRA